MFKPENELVISYNYLWAREHDRHVRARLTSEVPITPTGSPEETA